MVEQGLTVGTGEFSPKGAPPTEEVLTFPSGKIVRRKIKREEPEVKVVEAKVITPPPQKVTRIRLEREPTAREARIAAPSIRQDIERLRQKEKERQEEIIRRAAEEAVKAPVPTVVRPSETKRGEATPIFVEGRRLGTVAELEVLEPKTKAERFLTSAGLSAEAERIRQKRPGVIGGLAAAGIGLASVPVAIIESPAETVGIAGAFAVSPALGFGLLAATSGEDIVTGLRTRPAFTAGQLLPLVVAPQVGRAPKRVAIARKAQILEKPPVVGLEPFRAETVEVFEFKPTEAGVPVLTRIIKPGEPVLTRTGIERQIRLREPGEAISPLATLERRRLEILEGEKPIRIEVPFVQTRFIGGEFAPEVRGVPKPTVRLPPLREQILARARRGGVQAKLTDIFVVEPAHLKPSVIPRPTGVGEILGVGTGAGVLDLIDGRIRRPKAEVKITPGEIIRRKPVVEPLSVLAERARFTGREAFGILPISKEKEAAIQDVRAISRVEQLLKPIGKERVIAETRLKPITAAGVKTLAALSPKVKEAAVLLAGQVPAVKTPTALEEFIKAKPRRITEELFRRIPTKPRPKGKPRLPPVIGIKDMIADVSIDKRRAPVTLAGFVAFIKRRGKFVPISKPVRKAVALDIGAAAVARTLAARFKVLPVGRPAEPARETGAFRRLRGAFREFAIKKGKRVALKDEFIQLRGKRLAAKGERREIQLAKRTSALKAKVTNFLIEKKKKKGFF